MAARSKSGADGEPTHRLWMASKAAGKTYQFSSKKELRMLREVARSKISSIAGGVFGRKIEKKSEALKRRRIYFAGTIPFI